MKNNPTIILLIALALFACSKNVTLSTVEETNMPILQSAAPLQSIVLGKKLDNPYTVENVNRAYRYYCDAKNISTRGAIEATHLYVRFLPANMEEYSALSSDSLNLYTYPLDYEIVTDGSYYHDPSVTDSQFTWLYTSVPIDYKFRNIRHEILDYCIYNAAADDRVAKAFAVLKAEQRTATKGGTFTLPILIEEDEIIGGGSTPISYMGYVYLNADWNSIPFVEPIKGVRIKMNHSSNTESVYTNSGGIYRSHATFAGSPSYQIEFQNSNRFKIGCETDISSFPKSYGLAAPAHAICDTIYVSQTYMDQCWKLSVINNAAYDWYSYCVHGLYQNINTPPNDMRIWALSTTAFGTQASTPMLNHGVLTHSAYGIAVIAESFIMLGSGWTIVSLLTGISPDVIIVNMNHREYESIYISICHELAHASHANDMGIDWWADVVDYEIGQYIVSGGSSSYGDGTSSDCGRAGVAEMWAYYMETFMGTRKYRAVSSTNAHYQCDTTYWFKPIILHELKDSCGISHHDLFDCLTNSADNHAQFKSRLHNLNNIDHEKANSIFTKYGF